MLRHGGVNGGAGTLDPLDGLLRALGNAGAAAVALGVVDGGHIVLQEDGLIRAVAHTEAAGDAADLAGLVDQNAPLSLLEHLTAGCGAMGFIWMTWRGQTTVQAVQPVHFSRSTTATPLMTWMASNLQARVQSQTQTPIGTGAGTAGNAVGSGAGLDALIVKAGAAVSRRPHR